MEDEHIDHQRLFSNSRSNGRDTSNDNDHGSSDVSSNAYGHGHAADLLVKNENASDDNSLEPSHYIDQATFHNIMGGESQPCYIYYCDSDETSLPIEILQRATVHVSLQPPPSDLYSPLLKETVDKEQSDNNNNNDDERISFGDETKENDPRNVLRRTFNMNKAVLSCKSMKPDVRVNSADLTYGTKNAIVPPIDLDHAKGDIPTHFSQRTRKTHLNLVGFEKPTTSPIDPQNIIQEMKERNDWIRSIMNF